MGMRSSSLANNPLAVTRELDGRYDVVLEVRDNLDLIEQVAGIDFAAILAELESAQDFTGITVVQGETVAWDAVNKILTVPKGDKGDKGDTGLTGPQGIQGIQGIQGETGLQGIQGEIGIQGIPGKSAYTVAVEGGFVGTEAQWLLSLVGDTGATGNGIASIVKTGTVGLVDTYTVTMTSGATATFTVTNGLDGVDGLDVDHIAQTSGTGAAGTVDVYTVWGDIAETVNLGTFNVYNGLNGTGIVNSVVAGANVTVDNTYPTSPVVGLGTNVTVQGNTFNGAEQLVKLGIDGKLPAIDGSNLTNMVGAVTSVAGKVGSVVLYTTDVVGLDTVLSSKQDTLVSGTNIKTVNSSSILGIGNLALLTSINPVITGSITEQVYNLTGTAINPANGTIQYKTVSANTTFTETLTSGQSVLLRLIGASNYTITFPTITWVGAVAPTLTANCAIVLWKEQSTLYGSFVGTLV